jgi:ABC-type multidrug transport system ATPase subunit
VLTEATVKTHVSSVLAIEIRGMTKRFGKIEAVRDLTFEVQSGRVTGFLGPNGAKSTTLRMLLALIHANAGEGTFGGRRCPRACRASRLRTRVWARSTCSRPVSPAG